jgi:hypothetical protein
MYSLISSKHDEQVYQLLNKRDEIEANCENFPRCKKENACINCLIFIKLKEIDNQIVNLINK